MGILPKILTDEENELNYVINKTEKDRYTYIVDFQKKKMIYQNGKPLIENKEKALLMFIQKLLITEIGKWKFHNSYGTNYIDLTYNKKYQKIVVKNEIERNLREQLIKYPDILAVEKLNIVQNYKTLEIEFNLYLSDNNKFNFKEKIEL